MIKVEKLMGGYMNCPIVNNLDLEIHQGEFFALLGPNGSGKSTLFKLITGQLPVMGGKILLCEKEISTFSKLEKAKKMAVLTQESQITFDYSVEEIVSLGRYPHQKGLLKQLSKNDWNVIEEVMEITHISHYRKTPFRMISGGEKQRVLLAKALAQEPEVLLLDEPTNHLDIKHTLHMLDLLKEWQISKGLTIFAILHDLNIASLYADRIALLHHGSLLEVGDVDTLRKVDQLKKVYEVKLHSESHPTLAKPQILMTPGYYTSAKLENFEHSYRIEQTKESLHVEFNQPLRTISNGGIGDGIQWLKHFCHFHVGKKEDCMMPEMDLSGLLTKLSILPQQGFGVMTDVELEDVVILKEEIDGIQLLAVVSVGMKKTNIVDSKTMPTISTINMMLFIDAHLTDGELVSAFMSATEAKVRAIRDLFIDDSHSDTASTETLTETILLGVTQQGEKTAYAGTGTLIGNGIGQIIYQGVQEAFINSSKRIQKDRESLLVGIFC